MSYSTLSRNASLLLAVFAVVCGRAAWGEARPNIVILVADDVGWADVGYHNWEMRTPQIDALVETGVELDAHYAMPACTPTRVALLTGRYPSRWGNHCTQAANVRALQPGTPTLATMLQNSGYRTALIGKWHLGSKREWGPNGYGFGYSFGSLAGAVGPFHHRYRFTRPEYERTFHRNQEFIEEDGHITDLATREAVQWIEKQTVERPFFLYVPFHAAHIPLAEEERWLASNSHIRSDDRRLFAAAVTHLDHAIGEIVAALDRHGHRDNTLILFFSDNGAAAAHPGGKYAPPDPALQNHSSNQPLRGHKAQTYEGGIRVPACVSWPARFAPRKLKMPLHVVDWLPTIASLTQSEIPPELRSGDGRDLLPWIAGEKQDFQPRTMYWVKGERRDWVAVRHGDWKIVGGRDRRWELFNVAEDPSEARDLAAERPDKLAEMLRRHEWEWAHDGGAESLFDGVSLDGWMTYDGQPAPPGWEVKDGEIHLRETTPRAGLLLSRRPVGDFDLSFEWRIASRGNSGIKYRVRQYGDSWRGLEYQMIDDEGYPYALPPEGSSGALYALYPPNDLKWLRPCGEYNSARIRVSQNRIEHWLNGKKIVSATVGDPEWYDRVVKSKFARNENFSENPIGRIMLTEHGSEAWFRNFKFKALPANKESQQRYLRKAAGY